MGDMQGETSEARCHYTSCVDSRYTYLKNVLKTDGKKQSTFRPQENLVRQETTEQRLVQWWSVGGTRHVLIREPPIRANGWLY